MSTLEEKLERFLEEHEDNRTHGITLEKVYRAARDCADAVAGMQSRWELWREELRVQLASKDRRIEQLEAGYSSLEARMKAVEEQLASRAT